MGAGRREVVWAGTAARALGDAVEFVARESPQSARQVLDAASVRELFVYKYRLIYEAHDSEVAIIAFLHGARDFTRIKLGR